MSQGLSHARGSTAGSAPRRELRFRIASTAAEFEAIHRLNHATFATEIPQHPANPEGRLVDRYHEDNTYAVCLSGGTVIGMVAGRCTRPFSLDHKVAELDRQLPPHRKAVEIRLLAITPAYRRSAVFLGLVRLIARHFRNEDCDLAVISGTVRQLKLYRHLGFCPFASPVCTAEAVWIGADCTAARSSEVQGWFGLYAAFRSHPAARLIQNPNPFRCFAVISRNIGSR